MWHSVRFIATSIVIKDMYAVLLTCLVGVAVGQVTLPHGHQLHELVDSAFARMDVNPNDGTVYLAEWEELVERDDVNNDSCVSMPEYVASHQKAGAPEEVANKMFHHFDHDNDGCLKTSDMVSEFHMVDHNHDNQISLHEWDQYFSHLITQLFGHGNGK